jgi:hypothetical protein
MIDYSDIRDQVTNTRVKPNPIDHMRVNYPLKQEHLNDVTLSFPGNAKSNFMLRKTEQVSFFLEYYAKKLKNQKKTKFHFSHKIAS